MATAVFHSKISAQAGTASNEVVTKSQLDTAEANAKNLANATNLLPTSKIANFQADVDARVQVVVDAAPAALDTLNELAAALGDDANFAATVNGQLTSLDGRVDALEASSGTAGYKANIGDNALSTFTVTHGLGTVDVVVNVVEVATGQTVYPVVTRTAPNTTSVDFGSTVPTANQFRVLVTAV